MGKLNFTNNWFEITAKNNWDALIPHINPRKILEIGSYEGASICYLLEKLGNQTELLEIHVIDTWEGGKDHIGIDMLSVEERFKQNIASASENKKVDIKIHKGFSHLEMAKLLASGFENYFDFVYVDGSHETHDVLTDSVLGFKLLRPGGVMAFDDYLWCDGVSAPKFAIDAFVNIFFSKLALIPAVNSQVYIAKK